ncbi:MAG: Mur ligase family protein [Candidatus Jorgensenbacteria bacterium]
MRGVLAPLFSLYHWLWAFAAAAFFRFPSRQLFMIGITGTKGKSTTAELIDVILRAEGKRIALLTSVWRAVGEKRERNVSGNSMPGRGAIQAFLRRAVRAGCTHAVIEVTSEGVCQHRHRFIDWDAAAFLNLAPEHIESHGSFEAYRAAKVAFFSSLAHSAKRERWFFVNAGDQNSAYFVAAAEKIQNAHIVKFTEAPAIKNPWFAPDFNNENAAAAAAVADALGIPAKTILEALENFRGVPGRLDYVQEKPFAVVVDYAHTPDSLEKVYQYLNSQLKTHSSKLICILGSAGGGRDAWKRPAMGKIAAQYCEEIILTDEDPYDENPATILDEIEKGIGINQQVTISIDQRLVNQHKSASDNRHRSVSKILDRREAIRAAVTLARPGDTVVMTGKGSESWIHMANGKKVAWNERNETETILGILNQ